jgi:hypothetical protein
MRICTCMYMYVCMRCSVLRMVNGSPRCTCMRKIMGMYAYMHMYVYVCAYEVQRFENDEWIAQVHMHPENHGYVCMYIYEYACVGV